MELNTSRTTFLLGAGASAEAGLPISSSLTRAMARLVDGSNDRELSRAINAAIGAMVAHDTARGRSAYDGVDIERLFSAVEMLADRDNQELAPFVSSWAPATSFAGGEAEFPFNWSDDFASRLSALVRRQAAGDERRFQETFAAGVVATQNNEHSDLVFGRLREFMLTHLQDLLRVDPDSVDYLAPLLNAERPIRIATLNYDMTVEDLAWRAGVSLTTGLETWKPGKEWSWDDSEIRLLKLHGSLNWAWHTRREGLTLAEQNFEQFDRATSGEWRFPNSWHEGGPGLVFGQRGKVRAEGPFIPILQALDEFLVDTDTLVVVGYSLRDEHINTAIVRWLNRAQGHVVLVDPYLPDFRVHSYGRTFRDDLLRAVHEPASSPTEIPRYRYPPPSWVVKEGHQILRKPTGEALVQLLGRGPSMSPIRPGASH